MNNFAKNKKHFCRLHNFQKKKECTPEREKEDSRADMKMLKQLITKCFTEFP
jgi:phage-related protein